MIPRTEPKMVRMGDYVSDKMKNSSAVFRIMNSPRCARAKTPVPPKSISEFRGELQEGRARPRREPKQENASDVAD